MSFFWGNRQNVGALFYMISLWNHQKGGGGVPTGPTPAPRWVPRQNLVLLLLGFPVVPFCPFLREGSPKIDKNKKGPTDSKISNLEDLKTRSHHPTGFPCLALGPSFGSPRPGPIAPARSWRGWASAPRGAAGRKKSTVWIWGGRCLISWLFGLNLLFWTC